MMAPSTRGAFVGAFVSIDLVGWLPEVSTRETPEDVLIAREEEEEEDEAMTAEEEAAIREISTVKLKRYLEQIPHTEALALMLHLGLLGYPRTYQGDIAETLCLDSQQIVSYMARRARVRVIYLAKRPIVDLKLLARALSPAKLDAVRGVYETASFAEAGRKRWPCPEDRVGPQRRAWTRVHANKVKREFFRAVAKLEKRPDLLEQVTSLRHLVEHLGSLSRHEGKGAWKQR